MVKWKRLLCFSPAVYEDEETAGERQGLSTCERTRSETWSCKMKRAPKSTGNGDRNVADKTDNVCMDDLDGKKLKVQTSEVGDEDDYLNDVNKWNIGLLVNELIFKFNDHVIDPMTYSLQGSEHPLILPKGITEYEKEYFTRTRYKRRNAVHIYEPSIFKDLLGEYMSIKNGLWFYFR